MSYVPLCLKKLVVVAFSFLVYHLYCIRVLVKSLMMGLVDARYPSGIYCTPFLQPDRLSRFENDEARTQAYASKI
jgi:hypothetical protein